MLKFQLLVRKFKFSSPSLLILFGIYHLNSDVIYNEHL